MEITELSVFVVSFLWALAFGASIAWNRILNRLGDSPRNIFAEITKSLQDTDLLSSDQLLNISTVSQGVIGMGQIMSRQKQNLVDSRMDLTSTREIYEALRDCHQATHENHDSNSLFLRVCAIISQINGIEFASIFAIGENEGSMICKYSGNDNIDQCGNAKYDRIVNLVIPKNVLRIISQPIWVHDIHAPNSAWSFFADAIPITCESLAILPIDSLSDQQKYLLIFSKSKDFFKFEIKNFFLDVLIELEYATAILHRNKLYETTQKAYAYLGQNDPLTALPNRAYFEKQTSDLVRFSERKNLTFAIFFLDIDHFKLVNDSLSHDMGDKLLTAIATRLKAAIREEDIVARFGGDEFVFLFKDIGSKQAAALAQKILNAVSSPLFIDQHELSSTCSIGVAMYPSDGNDLASLCKCADAAMYEAKRLGRNRYCFFTAEMQLQSKRHVALVNALKHALERNEFSINYQAQVSIPEGRIIGAEALLRWNSLELGSVSPQEFIPACEESGLIGEIGEWVIRQATRHANIWRAKGLQPIVISVNLSAAQFLNVDLPSIVSEILIEEGMPPEYLEFELTESLAMKDPRLAMQTMDLFAEKGLKMSIDDFGTGYSSLSYLKKFRISKLKIDKSFVQDIASKPEDRAIVLAIIQMASSLGMSTIAEGVEDIEQLEFLLSNGCGEFQGYLVNMPMEPTEFETFLKASEHRWDRWFVGNEPTRTNSAVGIVL